MKMFMQWKKRQEAYELHLDTQVVATFQIPNPREPLTAILTIGMEQFTLSRPGFWKTHIVVHNEAQKEILRLQPQKWYSSSLVFNYYNQSFRIRSKNNPLLTWSIENEQKTVLEYGLTFSPKGNHLQIKVEEEVPLLFHGLLWYLMHTILLEQNGIDDASLVVLLV